MIGVRRSFHFPSPVYPIIDTGSVHPSPLELAERLLQAGAPLLQLRAKNTPTGELCNLARAVQARVAARGALLLVNDRADIARLIGAAGVHLGQNDLHPDAARGILGPQAIIGFSTHNPDQVRQADALTSIDYVGFGPIFATASKANADPRQGLAGLAAVRALTALPLVAIGGIGPVSAESVFAAGADAVAMIGAFASATHPDAVLGTATRLGRAALERRALMRFDPEQG